jgi:Ca2+-binding RTX toxin-like protein
VAAGVTVNLVTGTATGQGNDILRNVENVVGSSLADTITGNAGNNLIDGGGGVDTVRFDGVAAAVTVNLLTGTATGQGTDTLRNIENVVGSSLADNITGNNGNNVLDGKGGADILAGLGGNDTYVVDNAADVVKEAAGADNDTVLASVSYKLGAGQSIETLETTSANAAVISLTGNELRQAIIGNGGANFINGGGGNDTLTGGGGADTFGFNTALSATGNVDRITDFDPGSDKISLAKSIFSALGNTGVLSAAAFFQGPAAHDADDRIIYNSSTGALSYDSNGNAAGGSTVFATLAPNLTLHAASFLVS